MPLWTRIIIVAAAFIGAFIGVFGADTLRAGWLVGVNALAVAMIVFFLFRVWRRKRKDVSSVLPTPESPNPPLKHGISKTVSIAAFCTGFLCVGLCGIAWSQARPGESPEPMFLKLVALGVMLIGLGVAGLVLKPRH
jgi:uncharacterized membrane protein YfcA